MEKLAERRCVPCHGGVPRLEGAETDQYMKELSGWKVVEDHHLSKGYTFSNFAGALEFVNRAGRVAEREGHHPDITFGWGYARVQIWTHAIDGLSESDFILAAKLDEMDERKK
ncbi:MAG: 4a-hydroxytetrahydrobiopterin dehydratase [Acidobacteria bacterium]|nr:4a-hydroxytetrahydrobiopterin dehydratase [Acidobacteriota bacterium]